MSEVAQTRAEAEAMELAPLLVVEPLKEYLAAKGIIDEVSAELSWRRIGEGHSNITYVMNSGERRFVLRRGPRPPLPPSTHDMLREAKIQKILSVHDVKTPNILDVCEDESILGVPFYIMDFLDGSVITDTIPPAFDNAVTKPTIAFATIDALAQLHGVDVSKGDVATIGRPDGYLERQVQRFAGLWPAVSQRVLPEVDELAEWLRDNLPNTVNNAVVHGDFRIGNLMFNPEPDASGAANVQAILDWEMATLGDPLADLGYFLVTYSHGDSHPTPLDLTPVTRSPEFPSRQDLAERYAQKTGADLSALPWYRTLALWKAAVFTEAIYTRYLRGERPEDEFVSALETGVPLLLEEAKKQRFS